MYDTSVSKMLVHWEMEGKKVCIGYFVASNSSQVSSFDASADFVVIFV